MRNVDSDTYSYTILVFRCPASSQNVQVDALVLELFEKARTAKYAVTSAIVMSFGRSAKKPYWLRPQLRQQTGRGSRGSRRVRSGRRTSFVRNGLPSKRLHGEAGNVNPELVAEGMEEIREECKK